MSWVYLFVCLDSYTQQTYNIGLTDGLREWWAATDETTNRQQMRQWRCYTAVKLGIYTYHFQAKLYESMLQKAWLLNMESDLQPNSIYLNWNKNMNYNTHLPLVHSGALTHASSGDQFGWTVVQTPRTITTPHTYDHKTVNSADYVSKVGCRWKV